MFSRITPALVLGLCLSAATASAADSTAIFKAPVGSAEASKSKRFAINSQLGRAWVEIDISHAFSESIETYRVAIPGLAYNKDKGEIIYTQEGTSVVCATVRTGGWFSNSQLIEPTGDCELTRRYVQVPIDDGFNVDVIEHFEVHFKPASDSPKG